MNELYECKFCHGMTPNDNRGDCVACGGPRDPAVMLAAIEKYHRMEIEILYARNSAEHEPLAFISCSSAAYSPVLAQQFAGVRRGV